MEALTTFDGNPLPGRLKAELSRELDVIELLLRQIEEVSAEHELATAPGAVKNGSPAALLARFRGVDAA